jgi:hypothetical protein
VGDDFGTQLRALGGVLFQAHQVLTRQFLHGIDLFAPDAAL